MSKYTEAKHILQQTKTKIVFEEKDYDNIDDIYEGYEWSKSVGLEALEIADRLEQGLPTEEIYKKNCQRCNRHDVCRERKRGVWCTDAIIYRNGYIQALADVRGDAE